MNASLRSHPKRIAVNQGEHFASGDPQVCLTAILGSCVAICLHDPIAKVGGMNHFLLPECPDAAHDVNGRYGAYLAELLINDVMALGGLKSRLEAKVFGGGKMFKGLRDVGASNAEFAEKFLSDESIEIVGGSTQGLQARRVEFCPSTGRAFQKFVAQSAPLPLLATPVNVGEVELF
jgi:chemotaxis protein CheD